ncbi:unnamed protein product, partial [Sphagnum jensenii]
RTACSAVCRHAVVKCSSVVEAAAADGSKQLLSSSGNTNASRKYLGKGKIVHGVSCSGEDYKSSLSAGGCLEIHNLKLLAGSSALSLQVEIWGLLHCISPPFVLPSKASPLGASVAKSAKSFAWNGTQKSIFKHGSAGQTMLGFIVELRMCPHLPSCARIGSYVGIVIDIPMPGQLVELNKQAWLLLTHYNVSQLHRLHVGAMVSKSLFKLSAESAVRHVHIMVLDSAGEKELLLGACFRSHGRVVLFFYLNVTTGKASVFVEPTSEGGHYSVGYPVVPLILEKTCSLALCFS